MEVNIIFTPRHMVVVSGNRQRYELRSRVHSAAELGARAFVYRTMRAGICWHSKMKPWKFLKELQL